MTAIDIMQEFLKAIIVGICVSAPVGPLGVLCIQRTINKGKWHGVVTGLGATTSDIIYAFLVGFSMNIIVDFISAHQYVIQLIGAIVIGFFGLHIYNTKPQEMEIIRKRKQKGELRVEGSIAKNPTLYEAILKNDYFHDYISAFGLCFSNPLIIFLFIGLFAQFHMFGTESVTLNMSCIFFIIVGAFLWWMTLTYIVCKFRKNFKEKGMVILNHITGGILIIAAVATAINAIIMLI